MCNKKVSHTQNNSNNDSSYRFGKRKSPLVKDKCTGISSLIPFLKFSKSFMGRNTSHVYILDINYSSFKVVDNASICNALLAINTLQLMLGKNYLYFKKCYSMNLYIDWARSSATPRLIQCISFWSDGRFIDIT
jgi:hypothetical protein